MTKRIASAFLVLLLVAAIGSADAPMPPPADRHALLDRFLAPDDPPLVSYRAFRHLSASTRGGKMQASLDAVTTLDPVKGFTFEITSSEGSSLIQKKVLIAALEAEQ